MLSRIIRPRPGPPSCPSLWRPDLHSVYPPTSCLGCLLLISTQTPSAAHPLDFFPFTSPPAVLPAFVWIAGLRSWTKKKKKRFKVATPRGNNNHDRASTRGHMRPFVSNVAPWVSFIHPSLFYIHILLHSWSLGAMPAAIGRRQGHTLDKLPIPNWGNIEREKSIHTLTYLWAI